MQLSLPQEFINRMKDMLREDFDDFINSYENDNYQALRLNLLKGDGAAFSEKYPSFTELSPVPWTKDGYYYPSSLRPGKHPYHEAGVYYIQEPSAMMPAAYLDPQPGERILDLCAAPGGKSTQTASALQQQGLLISNEIHPARARILSENIERMGIQNAVVVNETPQTLARRFPIYFDRIIVDAPCSGEGMFRKNEEAVKQWSLENVRLCADRQDEILACAHQMLKPGGCMVYSTCTFAPDENEGSISRFLQQFPDYEVLKQERLWPHKIKGEGHFVALLRKKGSSFEGTSINSPESARDSFYLTNNVVEIKKEKKKSASGKGMEFSKQLEDFLSQNLARKFSGRLELFGDQLYLLPAQAPDLSGLRVLRPGLHLGTILKNRFEPSHALALTLNPSESLHVVSFDTQIPEDYRKICDYINGQTFPYEGEKGWYLICMDGYSLGWGKLAGGIMKNHYPKGLRKRLE